MDRRGPCLRRRGSRHGEAKPAAARKEEGCVPGSPAGRATEKSGLQSGEADRKGCALLGQKRSPPERTTNPSAVRLRPAAGSPVPGRAAPHRAARARRAFQRPGACAARPDSVLDTRCRPGHRRHPLCRDAGARHPGASPGWTLLTKVETSCDRILIAGGANVEAEWEQGSAV